MRQTYTTWLIAISTCALFGAHLLSALAQENEATEPDKPRQGVRVSSSSTSDGGAGGVISGQPQLLSDLLDAQVLLQDDNARGDITDLVLSPRGSILYAVATHNGRNYLIPYRGMRFNAADQTVQVNLTPEQFQNVQFFEGRNLPDVNSFAVRRQIMSLFVAGPAPALADRRMEENSSHGETDADRDRQDANGAGGDSRASAPDRSARDSVRNNDRIRVEVHDRVRDDRPGPLSDRTVRSATEGARQTISSRRFPDAKKQNIGGATPPNLVPSRISGSNPNVHSGRQPNQDAPTTPGTPGGAPVAPPGAATPGTPGGPPVQPPGNVTNPGGPPIKPPSSVTPNPSPTNPGTNPPR
jgi:hypothetical protein